MHKHIPVIRHFCFGYQVLTENLTLDLSAIQAQFYMLYSRNISKQFIIQQNYALQTPNQV